MTELWSIKYALSKCHIYNRKRRTLYLLINVVIFRQMVTNVVLSQRYDTEAQVWYLNFNCFLHEEYLTIAWM